MESATCCGMELARSVVWNHHEVMYGINPKERYTLARDAMPSQSDGFHSPHFARRLHTNPTGTPKARTLASGNPYCGLDKQGADTLRKPQKVKKQPLFTEKVLSGCLL